MHVHDKQTPKTTQQRNTIATNSNKRNVHTDTHLKTHTHLKVIANAHPMRPFELGSTCSITNKSTVTNKSTEWPSLSNGYQHQFYRRTDVIVDSSSIDSSL